MSIRREGSIVVADATIGVTTLGAIGVLCSDDACTSHGHLSESEVAREDAFSAAKQTACAPLDCSTRSPGDIIDATPHLALLAGALFTERRLGARLALWYAVAFGVGLFILGVGMWFTVQRSLYHAIDESLRDRVDGIHRFIEDHKTRLSLDEVKEESGRLRAVSRCACRRTSVPSARPDRARPRSRVGEAGVPLPRRTHS